MIKVKQRKPWNRVDQQVYSIVTLDEMGNVNMNIATYVVPISMQPKKYVLAIYRNTKTYKNIFYNFIDKEKINKNKFLILQALSFEQINLVKVLGKKTGLKYDKKKYLEKINFLQNYTYISEKENLDFKYLKNNAFTLLLEIEKYIEVGDHDLVVCRNIEIIENNYSKKLLTNNDLQEAKIIS
jgi:flavin reductase (DIM6/NTAB) family NADH-FMN oxidoreductase RutF